MTLRTPPSWLEYGVHSAEDDRLILTMLSGGVAAIGEASHLKVTAMLTPTWNVHIAAGGAWVPGTYPGEIAQGTYHCHNDMQDSVPVLPNSSMSPNRIDSVVLEVLDGYVANAGASTGSNQAHFRVVPGLVAGIAPARPANSIVLANITVPLGSSSVGASQITDKRPMPYTAPGAMSRVNSEAEMNAIPEPREGRMAYRMDTHKVMFYNGTVWGLLLPDAMSVVANDTERDALLAYEGRLVYRLDTHIVELWDGTVWKPLQPDTIPRVNATEQAALTSRDGDLTYRTDLATMQIFKNSAWVALVPQENHHFWHGRWKIGSIASYGGFAQVAIVFPANVGFTLIPQILATPGSGRLNCAAVFITPQGFTLQVNNWSPHSSSPCYVNWYAAGW